MTVIIIKKKDILNLNQDEIAIRISDDVVSSDIHLKAFHSVYNTEDGREIMSFEDLDVRLLNTSNKLKSTVKS